MGWFRRKTEVLDAEHLMREAAQTTPSAQDPASTPVVASGDSGDFRLTVADVFAIRNRGTVVTGQVESGSVSVGSEVAVTRGALVLRRVKVIGVEMFRKKLGTATAGQNVGLLLDDVSREDVAAGDVLTA
jgi:elongation factor Tu